MSESTTQQHVGRILDLIRAGKSFLITSQLDPDGDSVGSQLALRRVILAELGAAAADRIAIVNQVACPKRYSFLPDTSSIVTPDDVKGRTGSRRSLADFPAALRRSARPVASTVTE